MFSNLSEGRCLDLKDFDNIIDIYISNTNHFL